MLFSGQADLLRRTGLVVSRAELLEFFWRERYVGPTIEAVVAGDSFELCLDIIGMLGRAVNLGRKPNCAFVVVDHPHRRCCAFADGPCRMPDAPKRSCP